MAIKTIQKEVPDRKYENQEENKVMEIYRDQHPPNPRNWDNVGIMVCSHKRYDLGDQEPEGNYKSWESVKASITDKENVKAILPIYLYDHSGLRMKTTPFKGTKARWDSGKVGFIYTTEEQLDKIGVKEVHRTKEKLKQMLRNEVQTYDEYLVGNVWRFKFCEDEELVDSCGGFYGDIDDQKDLIFEQVNETVEDYELTEQN